MLSRKNLMFSLIHFYARCRLLLVFDFTVACVIHGSMEWVTEGSIGNLGLDSMID